MVPQFTFLSASLPNMGSTKPVNNCVVRISPTMNILI